MASNLLVNSIDVNQLAITIQSNAENIIIIDGRSFLDFNTSHIANAVNVCCSKIVKRRLQQAKLSVKDFLMKTCHVVIDENINIIVYDQESINFSETCGDSFIYVLLTKLILSFNHITLLKGGFSEFQAKHPSLCEDKRRKCPPISLSQPCLPINENGPTKILPFLYLGSQHDAMNSELLLDHNITYELNVSISCPKAESIPEGHFLRISVNDNFNEKLIPHFERAFQFIDKVREVNGCVLIHCLAGISRSPTIAIAYIMKHFHWKSDEAYRYVKSKRATISPNFNFLGQLLEYEQLLQSTVVLQQSRELDLAQSFHHTQLNLSPKLVKSEQRVQNNHTYERKTGVNISERSNFHPKNCTKFKIRLENSHISRNHQKSHLLSDVKKLQLFGKERITENKSTSQNCSVQNGFEQVNGMPLSALHKINFTACQTFSKINQNEKTLLGGDVPTFVPLYSLKSQSKVNPDTKMTNLAVIDELNVQKSTTAAIGAKPFVKTDPFLTKMIEQTLSSNKLNDTQDVEFEEAPMYTYPNYDDENRLVGKKEKEHVTNISKCQVANKNSTSAGDHGLPSTLEEHAIPIRKDDRLYRANSCPGILGFVQCPTSENCINATVSVNLQVNKRKIKLSQIEREYRARNRHSSGGLECMTDYASLIFDSCPDFTIYQSNPLSPVRRPFHRNLGVIKVA